MRCSLTKATLALAVGVLFLPLLVPPVQRWLEPNSAVREFLAKWRKQEAERRAAAEPTPPPETVPVLPRVALRAGGTVETAVAAPGELLIDMQHMFSAADYELRVSFPGTPLMRYSIELLAFRDPQSAQQRRLLDTERIVFVPGDGVTGAAATIHPGNDGFIVNRTARLRVEPLAVVSDTAREDWTHAHMVLSLRATLLGGLPIDTVPVIILAAVLVPVIVFATRYVLMDDLHPQLPAKLRAGKAA